LECAASRASTCRSRKKRHGDGEDAIAKGSQAVDTLSGNTIMERRHRKKFSGSREAGQKRGAGVVPDKPSPMRTRICATSTADFLRTLAGWGWECRVMLRCCVLLFPFLIGHTAQAQIEPLLTEQSAQNPTTPEPNAPEAQPSKTQDQDGKPSPAQTTGQTVKQLPQEAEKETEKLGELALSAARAWEVSWLIGPYSGRQRPLVPLTNRQRQRIYLQQTFTTPSPYLKRMIVAGFDQWREAPLQWGDGWGAYGKRFASREGQFTISNSLTALGDAKLKYEPMYDQCECGRFWPRARHAIVRNFLTYNSSEHELRPQWALYAGAFAGGVISATWRPSSHSLVTNGLFAMVGQAGYGSVLNFFIEFAIDINHKMGGRRSSIEPIGN
jgi:hypothetical protein